MTFSGSGRSMSNHALKTPWNESETMRCGERSGMKTQRDPTGFRRSSGLSGLPVSRKKSFEAGVRRLKRKLSHSPNMS